MREAASEHGRSCELFPPVPSGPVGGKQVARWQRVGEQPHLRAAMSRITGVATARALSRLLAVVVTVVVITTLYLAKTVILPLALALLLSFVLAPVVTGLERMRVPRILAVPVVVLATGAILGAFGWTVFVQLVEVPDALPAYT